MAVLLGAISSGKSTIDKIKKMYSSAPSADYERFLFLNANHRNPKVRKFVRERLEKSFNPKGDSRLKMELAKYFNK